MKDWTEEGLCFDYVLSMVFLGKGLGYCNDSTTPIRFFFNIFKRKFYQHLPFSPLVRTSVRQFWQRFGENRLLWLQYMML